MTVVKRVLPDEPVADLAGYEAAGGGRGLAVARRLDPDGLIEELEASGLRGRGGAGFPTGTKWRTVAGNTAADLPATVIVNGAEGEPGTFKDRAIMRRNPYAVVEGAVIASLAVGADRAAIAIKSSFKEERDRLERAINEAVEAGWTSDLNIAVVEGPGEYLFGEETALLEVLDGRPPFPRIAPPYRHGIDEVGAEPRKPAGSLMAAPGAEGAPPTLVNNVETLANVPGILADGADWFRELGTTESPGSVVCTISGATARAGVAEIAMGTTLADAIALIGGGPRGPSALVAAVPGVANAMVPAERFDTPLTYEDMRASGSGLGAAGFIVLDGTDDLVAVAQGISRFLAIESCGQCVPCKSDGLAIAEHLDRIRRSDANELDLGAVADLVGTVTDEARCYLAQQHQTIIDSVLRLFPDPLREHIDGTAEPSGRYLIAPIVDITDDGVALIDESELAKRADWTYDGDAEEPTKSPVDRLARRS